MADGLLVLLAALALAPVLLARGFVLVGDMTFVPAQPWSSAWLGLDGSVPRAVPADAFTSVLSHLVPGDLLQKAILLGALVLAGIGMRRLSSSLLAPNARLAPWGAGVLYLWNPWVLERLAIGHWGLLLGYAVLPWIASAAWSYRRGTGTLTGVVLGLAVAAFSSPTGGIVAALVAVVLGTSRTRRSGSLRLIGVVAAINLPWLLPGLLGSADPSDPGGVAAFAARSDSPYGVLGSLLSFGGIWKGAIVPGERSSVLLVGLAVLLTLSGIGTLIRRARSSVVTSPAASRLLGLGALGLALALVPATGPGADLVTWLVRHLPGAGILRDSQKWLALFVLAVCVGVGFALDAMNRWLRRSDLPARAVTGGIALAPLLLLPSLGWGIAGELEAVSYPAEWSQVRQLLAAQPASDRRTVVLPFSAYQRYSWNAGRAALDPALRYFPGDMITNDALKVAGRAAVAGDSPVAARIAAAYDAGRALGPVLHEAGIRYVLIERPETTAVRQALTSLRPVSRSLHAGHDLVLLDLGSGRSVPAPGYGPVVIVGDVAAFGAALMSAVLMTVRRIRGKKDKSG